MSSAANGPAVGHRGNGRAKHRADHRADRRDKPIAGSSAAAKSATALIFTPAKHRFNRDVYCRAELRAGARLSAGSSAAAELVAALGTVCRSPTPVSMLVRGCVFVGLRQAPFSAIFDFLAIGLGRICVRGRCSLVQRT